MNVDARLQLTMSQKLVMTPMLQQAIKLLQMSRLELVDLVKQELLENPVLDELDNSEDYVSGQASLRENPDGNLRDDLLLGDQGETPALDVIGLEKRERQPESSINWEDYFADNPGGLGYYGEREIDSEEQPYESVVSQRQTLADHLTWQLQMSQVPERTTRIGLFLIGQIDDDGYIRCQDSFAPQEDSTLALGIDELLAYRSQIVAQLCQKLNAAIEQEHLATAIDTSTRRGLLAMILSQEYYEDVEHQHYDRLVQKLRPLTFEDLALIGKFIAEFPANELAHITGVPADEIVSGATRIQHICQDLRDLVEQHCPTLLKEHFESKLEDTGLRVEEFYLLEYLLLHVSIEEIAYVASHENSAKAAKREQDIRAYLEKLQQSYAHVEQLESRKYVLIQLYRIGVGILIAHLKEHCPPRYQKLLFKLTEVGRDEIVAAAAYVSELVEQYYHGTSPVSTVEIEHTLRYLQSFSPPGVAARDIKECLCIQARNLGIADTPIELIIEQYLAEIRHHQFSKIAEALGISVEDVELVAQIIANMSPKPGSDFSHEPPEYIVPDIYVYKVDGEYEVVLNEDELPYLRINPLYKKLMLDGQQGVSQATKQYVEQKLRSAMWFIRSVEQRKRTIYKVGKSIVKFQHEFLEHGLSHLKPLVLRDVADDISMHESTVSRVTTNKYIHTPQGVFELKYFFHSGLESSSGSDVSSIAVKERIKQLITEEDAAHPLSDKTLETILKKEGIAIARRTVAKYREELNIPSSLDRKRS